MRRTAVLVAVAAAGLVSVALAVVAIADGRSRPLPAASAPPAVLAGEVCVRILDGLATAVREDAPAEQVLDELDVTVGLARRAAEADPRWIALAGAVGALRVSLYEDDPQQAGIAVRVLTTECGRREGP